MKELAQLLNEMRTAGVIQNYALFGAAAQMRAARHGLSEEWRRFERRFVDE